jgi:hypothetical protein
MQLSVLTTELANTIGGGNASRYPDWIAEAYSRVIAMRLWSFRIARVDIPLAANAQSYPLVDEAPAVEAAAPDFGGVLDVSLVMTTGGFAVPLMGCDSPQLFDRITRHNVVAGTPMLYCITAGAPPISDGTQVRPGGRLELRLSPKPTAADGQGQALDLLYVRTTESLKPDGDSDWMLGPELFGYAVLAYAKAIGFANVGNLPSGQYWQATAAQMLQALITQDEAILPVRDANRISQSAPPNLSGPAAGQIGPPDLPLPIPRAGGAQ